MPRHRLLLIVMGLGFLLSNPVLRAHHAEAAEYDATKPVKVSGMLTKVEWQNPHVWFYVEVKEDGKAYVPVTVPTTLQLAVSRSPTARMC